MVGSSAKLLHAASDSFRPLLVVAKEEHVFLLFDFVFFDEESSSSGWQSSVGPTVRSNKVMVTIATMHSCMLHCLFPSWDCCSLFDFVVIVFVVGVGDAGCDDDGDGGAGDVEKDEDEDEDDIVGERSFVSYGCCMFRLLL